MLPQMDLHIRPARPEEAPTLSEIAFSAKAYWGYPELWMERWRPQLTFDPQYIERYECWVAETNSTPIGFYTLEERQGKAWLENLWVSPTFIGQGMGRRLFCHAAELSRERGFRIIQLEADPNAAAFYGRMGMCQIGERHAALDGQLRALPIMEMNL